MLNIWESILACKVYPRLTVKCDIRFLMGKEIVANLK